MPPRNIKTWKNVTYVRPSTDDKTGWGHIKDIIKEIYSNRELKSEIDWSLNEGSKINAIKLLKQYMETYHKSRKYSLRTLKDTIDKYESRLIIRNKIEMLRDRIEKWCEKNGYEKVGLQKEVKSKTGEYIYRYSDWEMIDDHEGLMINDPQWRPSGKQMKQYNKLWKKYEAKV